MSSGGMSFLCYWTLKKPIFSCFWWTVEGSYKNIVLWTCLCLMHAWWCACTGSALTLVSFTNIWVLSHQYLGIYKWGSQSVQCSISEIVQISICSVIFFHSFNFLNLCIMEQLLKTSFLIPLKGKALPCWLPCSSWPTPGSDAHPCF